MNKLLALDTLTLLSAIESWECSTGQNFPDYINDRMNLIMLQLHNIVMEANDE